MASPDCPDVCEYCGHAPADECDCRIPDDPSDDVGEWESCWHCGGHGGWHDCGEDCCCCAEPEDNYVCPECNGRGGWFQ